MEQNERFDAFLFAANILVRSIFYPSMATSQYFRFSTLIQEKDIYLMLAEPVYVFMRIKFTFCVLFMLAFIVGCNNEPDLPDFTNVLHVYPNPVRYEATITIQNAAGEPYKLLVFDTKGDLILQEDDNENRPNYKVHLDSKPEGIYQIILKIGNRDYSQNILKIK